jgi:hypothetical protein
MRSPRSFLTGLVVAMVACTPADQRAFEESKQRDTIEAYQQFMRVHPQSRRVPQAREAIARLEEQRFQAAASSLVTLRDFLIENPEGRFTARAKERLKDLLKTPLGVLVGAQRSEEAVLQIVCYGDGGSTIQLSPGVQPTKAIVTFGAMLQGGSAVCGKKEKARRGHVYLVLSFEGEATRELSTEAYASTPRSRWIGVVDKGSRLTPGTGTAFTDGFLAGAPSKTKRQLAFEIPTEAASLTWHDGERSYPLDVLTIVG